jgi:hypothetical protein
MPQEPFLKIANQRVNGVCARFGQGSDDATSGEKQDKTMNTVKIAPRAGHGSP